MKSLLLILSIFTLTGCALWETKSPEPVEVEKVVVFHPPWDFSVRLSNVKYITLTPEILELELRVMRGEKVMIKNRKGEDVLYEPKLEPGTPYMALTWVDYLRLADNVSELEKALKSMKHLLCYYRRDLKESKCAKYKTHNEIEENALN